MWIIKSSFHYQRVTCTFTEDNQVRFKVFDNFSVTELKSLLETAVVKDEVSNDVWLTTGGKNPMQKLKQSNAARAKRGKTVTGAKRGKKWNKYQARENIQQGLTGGKRGLWSAGKLANSY